MILRCVGGKAAGQNVEIDRNRRGLNVVIEKPFNFTFKPDVRVMPAPYEYEYYEKMKFQGNSMSYFVLVPEGTSADAALRNLINGYKK